VTSVFANGCVYAIAGAGAAGDLDTVLYARQNASGGLGAWTPTASLPRGYSSHDSALWKNHLYVGGGGQQRTTYADVAFTTLHADCTLQPWTTTTPFNQVRLEARDDCVRRAPLRHRRRAEWHHVQRRAVREHRV